MINNKPMHQKCNKCSKCNKSSVFSEVPSGFFPASVLARDSVVTVGSNHTNGSTISLTVIKMVA